MRRLLFLVAITCGCGSSPLSGADAGIDAGVDSQTPSDASSDVPSDALPPSAACIDEVTSCTSIASQIANAIAASPSGTVTVSVPPCLNEHAAPIPYRELVRIPGATSTQALSRPIVLS